MEKETEPKAPVARKESFTESLLHGLAHRHDYEVGSALGGKK
jgi:hypothetical protein